MTSSHTDFTLPVLFKELDHIQAIVGRFDTFFFLMKQLCLVYVAAILGLYFDGRKIGHPAIALCIPVIFLLFEVSFRYCFWTSYIYRVEAIGAYLNGETDRTRLYVLNDTAPRGYRFVRAFKKFDALFYALVFIVTCVFAEHDIRTLSNFISRVANGCHDVQTPAPAALDTQSTGSGRTGEPR